MEQRRKKEAELRACRIVAAEINRTTGSDYQAICGETEPVDVLLVSSSNPQDSQPVQVVSAPFEYKIRRDNHNVEKACTRVGEALERHGFCCCDASIWLTGRARERGVRPDLVRALVDCIAFHWDRRSYLRLTAENHFYSWTPQLCHFFSDVRLYRPESQRICVSAPQAFDLPRDGRWLREAVEKKKQYDPAILPKLNLVIDGDMHLDFEQIDNFRLEMSEQKLPFREVWVVSMGKSTKL